MTDHIESASKEDLEKLAAVVDAATGPYPKPGVNIGRGIHVPPEQSQTLRYAAVRKHPDEKVTAFAYPVDAVVAPVLAAIKAKPSKTADEQKVAALSAPAKLDDTWAPKLDAAVGADADPEK